MEPSLIPYHPGSNSPGGLLFFERLLPSGIVFFQAFLGQVAWFFSGAGGLIFFKHWPTFFLTFAVSCFIHFENNGHGMMSDLDRQKVKTLSKFDMKGGGEGVVYNPNNQGFRLLFVYVIHIT